MPSNYSLCAEMINTKSRQLVSKFIECFNTVYIARKCNAQKQVHHRRHVSRQAIPFLLVVNPQQSKHCRNRGDQTTKSFLMQEQPWCSSCSRVPVHHAEHADLRVIYADMAVFKFVCYAGTYFTKTSFVCYTALKIVEFARIPFLDTGSMRNGRRCGAFLYSMRVLQFFIFPMPTSNHI